MAVYHGREGVQAFAFYLRLILDLSFDEARRYIQLCQRN
jgi:hypothetical protein